ncbi:hypothetical protein M9H77_06214 [Catharanthus roseus]|uniref:Uncharacterized protein n=1 Tax=Catharanthus roseus TaxID=4058 RepID=A0ACC0BRM9_CATRO|nr:hypothetical protein M9H77_06214 [Catharanthus roseus]
MWKRRRKLNGCDCALEFAFASESYDVNCECSDRFCWNCTEEIHRPVDCETIEFWHCKAIIVLQSLRVGHGRTASDGGLKPGISGTQAISAIIRNHNGQPLTASALAIPFTTMIFSLEAQTVILGVTLASHMGISNFDIETNSLNVCNRVNSTSHNCSPTGLFIREIRGLLLQYPSTAVKPVNRNTNTTSPNLAD